MGQITLRPELVTGSGEACGIMLDDQYVGSFMLLYREEDRIWGTVQLDEEVLHSKEKEEIDLFIHQYVENMIDALGVPECFITVSYSEYDHIISTDNLGEVQELIEVNSNIDHQGDQDNIDVTQEDHLQLTIVGESRNKVEYQLLNRFNELVAEALLTIYRGDVSGEIYWQYEPSEEDMDEVAQIIVTDFDSEQVDTFHFTMRYADEELASVELTHEDLLEFDENITTEVPVTEDVEDRELYVDVYSDEDQHLYFEMIRDDIDTVIFDIFEEKEGLKHTRLGTVTLNLDDEEITGLVDFINPGSQALREQIAYQLIDHLGDEVEYQTFTLTMQYHDEVIDELMFDTREQPEAVYN